MRRKKLTETKPSMSVEDSDSDEENSSSEDERIVIPPRILAGINRLEKLMARSRYTEYRKKLIIDRTRPENESTDTQPESAANIQQVQNRKDEANPEESKSQQTSSNQSDVQPDFDIFVRGCETDITRVNPRRVQTDIRDIIGRTPNIQKVHNSLRIKCQSDREKWQLINSSHLAGHRVKFTEPYWKISRIGQVKPEHRGIIFGVEEEISNEEMSSEIGTKAERVIKRYGGQTRKTQQMILYFDGELPQYISYGYRRFKVSKFIPEPTRCFNCQRYGHKAKECSAKTTCPICAGRHSYEDCTVKDSYRHEGKAVCPNCRGPHPASYKGCVKYQHAKEVVEIKTRKNISYAEAVKTIINKKKENQEHIEQSKCHTGNTVDPADDQPATQNSLPKGSNGNNTVESDSERLIEQNETVGDNAGVEKLTLTIFVQKISQLLTQHHSKPVLIHKLYELVTELVKHIT